VSVTDRTILHVCGTRVTEALHRSVCGEFPLDEAGADRLMVVYADAMEEGPPIQLRAGPGSYAAVASRGTRLRRVSSSR
jgi:hypothetical protein